MEIEEFNEMIKQMLEQVNAIIHRQKVIAEIKSDAVYQLWQVF